MSIVGKVTKQPGEAQFYSVAYDDDLDANENLQSAYHYTYNKANCILPGMRVTQSVSGTAVAADNYKVFICAGGITLTLANGAVFVDGNELYISNASLAQAVTIASSELIAGASTYNLPVNKSVVLRRSGGTWIVQALTQNIVVALTGDHRVRLFWMNGIDGATYISAIVTTTDEGRVLEDELQVRVKET